MVALVHGVSATEIEVKYAHGYCQAAKQEVAFTQIALDRSLTIVPQALSYIFI